MNILFHAHEFNINEGGPCTKRVDSLAKYLVEKGHKVTVITSSHNKKTEKQIDRNYEVLYSYSTKKIKKSSFHRLFNNLIFGITSYFKVILKIKNIDVVVTTSPPPLISLFGYAIAKNKRAKLVYDVRDIWPDVAIEMNSFKKGSIYDKVFSFIAKFMYKHSDIITTVSPGKVEKMKKYTESSKVKYIPNGFDDEFTKFELDYDIVKKYNLDNKFTMVYIGNVGLAQNLDALVELAIYKKENTKIQFLIFGDGAYKEKIEKTIKEKSLKNIKIAGKIEYSKVQTILKYSKISFVSLKNNNMTDSIPTKMFDALGIGCPVLLLASGDSCKILKKSGLGENAKNIEELKNKFDYMLENYNKYEEKSEECIKFIQKEYSRREIAKKFEMEVIKGEK